MREFVLIFVNGQRHEVRGRAAFLSLSDFLRNELGLVGTKVVCAEGDCGSCSVLLGRVSGGKLSYRPVCSCIQFLYQLDCTHIITIEGLKYAGQLNPVQEALVSCQGSQCGFCTPGFVVSLCSMFQDSNLRPASASEVQKACVGNLCRCTGYETILRAGVSVEVEKLRTLEALYPPDPILNELAVHAIDVVQLTDGVRTFRKPLTLTDACGFRKANPGCTVIAGGTDIGVQINKLVRETKVILSLSALDELRSVSLAGGVLKAGALCTLADLERAATTAVPEFGKLLYWFGSPPIKNAGTLGGNIANGSPIADTLPALYVLNAEIELTGIAGERRVNINDFYTGYKANVMQADELISAIYIPLPAPGDFFKLYKISRRKDLDISAFTAGIWMQVSGASIAAARLAYGGVGPNIVRLKKTEQFLLGRPLIEKTFTEAGVIAAGEIAPISDVRGSADFRLRLAENILHKLFAELDPPRTDGRTGLDGGGPHSGNGSNGLHGGNRTPNGNGHTTGSAVLKGRL